MAIRLKDPSQVVAHGTQNLLEVQKLLTTSSPCEITTTLQYTRADLASNSPPPTVRLRFWLETNKPETTVPTESSAEEGAQEAR